MTRELIDDMREVILPFVKEVLLKTNYEGLGKSDAKVFERDFNEILNLAIKALEQEPKAGHWIKGYTFPDGAYWKCDKCNELIKVKIPMRYCNNCGAKMVEPQESEGKE